MYKKRLPSLISCALMAFTLPVMAETYVNTQANLTIPDPNPVDPACKGINWTSTAPQDWNPMYFGSWNWQNTANKVNGNQCMVTPPLLKITASDAFDAYQKQALADANGNIGNKVILLDVRTP